MIGLKFHGKSDSKPTLFMDHTHGRKGGADGRKSGKEIYTYGTQKLH